MEWFLEDAAGVEYRLFPDDFEIKLYQDGDTFRPSEASLTISRKISVKKNQWIRAVENGKTQFLGYVSRSPSISQLYEKTVTCMGVEALLLQCPCPAMNYYIGLHLSEVFADSAPDPDTQACDWPGLLFAANSLIPPGWLEGTQPTETVGNYISHGPANLYDSAKGIVKYPNMGTKSRIGTAEIFVNGYPYTEYPTYAAMEAADTSIYRDLNDLYIRHINDYTDTSDRTTNFTCWQQTLPVFAKNAFDTRCRLGTIAIDETLALHLAVGPDQNVGDIIFNLAKLFGQFVRVRYVDQLCYLDLVEGFDDTYSIREDECKSIKYHSQNQIIPDAITGVGAGSITVKQLQSISDVTSLNSAFIRKVAVFPGTFFNGNRTLLRYDGSEPIIEFVATAHHGKLFERVTAEFIESQFIDSISIEADEHDSIPPGSNIEYSTPEKTDTFTLCEKSMSRDKTSFTLNKIYKSINDALKGVGGVGAAYPVQDDFVTIAEIANEIYMVYYYYIPVSTQLTIYNGTATVPSWGKNNSSPFILSKGYQFYRDNNIRVLLDFKGVLDTGANKAAYEEDTYLMIRTDLHDDHGCRIFNPECSIKFNPLEDEIVGWDITKYVLFPDSEGIPSGLVVTLEGPSDFYTHAVTRTWPCLGTIELHESYYKATARCYLVREGPGIVDFPKPLYGGGGSYGLTLS